MSEQGYPAQTGELAAQQTQPATPDAQPAVAAAPSAASSATQPDAPGYLAGSEPVNNSGYSDPELPSCPNCKVGVLYVIAWDPKATHEIGQPIYAPALLSGGSVSVSCFNCGYGESKAMNPTTAPPNPNPGA